MRIPTPFHPDTLLSSAKNNLWMRYFSVFCRVALAAGFIPSGMVKIMGDRFTSLSNNHPMGHYLEALHHTGYYYTFIGIAQVSAAILLLIPRTVALGALLYFPIILNICILSLALRFDGSRLSSPLMVLANLFLLCWNYDRLKFILAKKTQVQPAANAFQESYSRKFPLRFFLGASATVILLVLLLVPGHSVMPRNTLKDCRHQFDGTNRKKAGYEFCDCIHLKGEPLDKSIDKYERAPDDSVGVR